MKQEQLTEYAHTVAGVTCRGDVHGTLCRDIRTALESAVNVTVHDCARKAEGLRNQAAIETQKARAAGNNAEFVKHLGATSMAEMVRRMILLPPGGCETCLNGREVPSTIVAGMMTRCPACAEQEGRVAQ